MPCFPWWSFSQWGHNCIEGLWCAVHRCTLGKCWLAIGGVFTTRHRIGLPRDTFTSIGQVRAKSFERPMMVRLIAGTQNNTGAQGIKLPSSRKTKRVSTIKLPKIFRRHNRCRAIQTDCENACASKYADVETQGYQILVIFFQLEKNIIFFLVGYSIPIIISMSKGISTSHFES